MEDGAFLGTPIGFGLRERLDARTLDGRGFHRLAFERAPLLLFARGLGALAIEADFRGAKLLEPLVFGANARLFVFHERAQRRLHGLVVPRIAHERPTREARFRLGNNFSRYMCSTHMARILVVDDDRQLIEVLSIALGDAGHEVKTANDGLDGIDAVKSFRPALVVADVNMPRLDGFQMCKRLRDAGDATPVVLLTSRDGEVDETLGLELGADDYVTKPFAMRVLVARIAAILRRDAIRAGKERGEAATAIGDLSIDADRVEAKWKGTIIPLTLTEFRVLEALARREGVVMTRDKLLELVRGDDSVVGERIVDVYVRRLRRKLEAIDPAFSRIETVVGMGYRWKDS